MMSPRPYRQTYKPSKRVPACKSGAHAAPNVSKHPPGPLILLCTRPTFKCVPPCREPRFVPTWRSSNWPSTMMLAILRVGVPLGDMHAGASCCRGPSLPMSSAVVKLVVGSYCFRNLLSFQLIIGGAGGIVVFVSLFLRMRMSPFAYHSFQKCLFRSACLMGLGILYPG